MDPVSNTDRLIALLRQKLQERSKSTGAGAAARKDSKESRPLEPTGIHALAAIDGVDERQVRRAFIQNLLADQFGSGLVNDGQFQQIVTRVTNAIDEDAGASQLLSRLIADLRAT